MGRAANTLAMQVAAAPDMSDVALVSGSTAVGSTLAGGAGLNAIRNGTRAKALHQRPA